MLRPLYKVREPFMDAPTGHGYLGVIMYDDDKDKIQCHLCGRWMSHMGTHVRQAHHETIANYREQFGLPLRGGLTSKSISNKQSKAASTPEQLARLEANRQPWINVPRTAAFKKRLKARLKQAHSRIAHKNKTGLCPAQQMARYLVVKKIVKREPTSEDIKKHDFTLHAFFYNHKNTLNKWKQSKGIEVRAQCSRWKFGNLELIANIRRWAKAHKRSPGACDFDRGSPSKTAYLRAFGSWQTALMQAGLR